MWNTEFHIDIVKFYKRLEYANDISTHLSDGVISCDIDGNERNFRKENNLNLYEYKYKA